MLAHKQESPTKGEGRGQHRWRWRRDLTLGVQEPHPRAAVPSPYGPQLSSKVVFLTPSAYTLLFSSYGVALEWGLFIIYQKSKINLI